MRVRPAGLALALAAALAGCTSQPSGDGDPVLAELRRRAAGGNDATEAAPGRWRSLAAESTRADELERLESIGYARGSRAAPARSGVIVHRDGRFAPGLNLYVSGHAPAAFLVDSRGREIHRWTVSYAEAWPGRSEESHWEASTYWRRARLLKDGSVLAIFEGIGLVKVDAGSNPVWAVANGAHHDLEPTDDGRIVVLTREARLAEREGRPVPVLEDFLTTLDEDGRELERVSVLECLERSGLDDVKRQVALSSGDVLHTNSLRLLEAEQAAVHPEWGPGCALVSFREIHAIAVIDSERRLATWSGRARFHRQHDPSVTPDGRLLVFDNGRRRSRVLELDPATLRTVWKYEGTDERPFFSETCGTAARLPNGNTLVTESDRGRAFEVTRDGEIVWEFVSPHRAGARDELVATLFDLVRIPPDATSSWRGPEEGTSPPRAE